MSSVVRTGWRLFTASRPARWIPVVTPRLTCPPGPSQLLTGSGSFTSMRLGVLDVGSNTVHLLVVDAHSGARPIPATSHKIELRLAEHLDDGGRISGKG